MRKGDATRARILDEAARQAARRGLNNVSLGDVGEAIGLSKSGLFKHFESKEAMQLAVIEQIAGQFADFVWGPAESLAPGRTRLETIFRRWLDWAETEWRESGCPMVAFSAELDDQPGAARDFLQINLNRWRKTLVREFKALRDPPMADGEAQACYFQMKSFILGHSDSLRMVGMAEARELALAAFEALLDRAARPPVRTAQASA